MTVFYEISLGSLALGILLLSIPAAYSKILQLRVSRDLMHAAVRAAVQLTIVGYVLAWVLHRRQPAIALAMLLLMLLSAGINTQRRQKFPYPWLWLKASVIIMAATLLPLIFVLAFVVRVHPWYEPRLLVPLAGMVMGNSMSAVVLGLERFHAGLKDRWPLVEARLALGATRYQACLPIVRGAARASLLPIINTMMVIGIVHLPGMIVGQITAGGDPAQASRYQLMILYSIATANSLATLGVVALGIARFTTPHHQLQYHLLEEGNGEKSGLIAPARRQVAKQG